jgi:uncharacterized OB-fold protein
LTAGHADGSAPLPGHADGSAPLAGHPDGSAPLAGHADRSAELAALVGRPTGPPQLSPFAVNAPMIRHWVEAMGDLDPVYVSDDAARAAGLSGVIAPPTMLQAWTMVGLRATLERESARTEGARRSGSVHEEVMALFDDEGLTSVVATNCEQRYLRPLVIGDRLVASSTIESISDVKQTALGAGRFLTTRTDFVAVPDEQAGPGADPAALLASGEPVATMRFRLLRFRPRPARAQQPARPRRPRPAITEDNAFWFEGARQHRLLIQRCTSCGTLRHPPLPACGVCRSLEWDSVESAGQGELYSFVVIHHPQVPAFDYPLPIGLIALREGTRLVADLEGVDPSDLRIGMPVEAHFVAFDDELTLPVFRPAGNAPAGP